ncbi:unnamed protein product [Spirodela intermedia]|uniref:Uncharacterized protein n=1 Tax=Spirodela intermedia TaxID=51605 RepID=A0A7I8IL04_SPIIN|nr:unnamed protein product [Spirodela intermedia]CAA6658073.1 unnamed protein product [Spirodela intermedia]
MRDETIRGRGHRLGSLQSDESGLDMERNIYGQQTGPNLHSSPPSLQPFASSGQHSESNAAYFSWPTSTRLNDAAEGRANFFGNLQKGVLPRNLDRLPRGQQASTLLDLMTIRASHSKILRCIQLGFSHTMVLLPQLRKEQLYDELADGLRGSDPCIGSGSQVASLETYGTLGAIVKSRTGMRQVGFLTNRHVAVDLDYPNQKMFHPLPPNLGPGVYLGAVERATSFITDDLWYGIFAGTNPETFVRADGAFIPFADNFDISNVTTLVKGVGEIGDVKCIDLQAPINSLIGRQVMKVGRSSGLTTGTVMAYALEYNDEKGICFFTDFLVVGENQKTFDLEGDSGSLIILTGQDDDKARPIGIIWGGTANRGRLKLKSGHAPENWTSGVDLGRLLDLLELDLITTTDSLQEAIQDQRNAMAGAIDSIVGESSQAEETPTTEKPGDIFEPLGFNIQKISVDGASGSETNACFARTEYHMDGIDVVTNVEEHQFIPNSPIHRNQEENSELRSLSTLRDASDEDLCFALHLGDRGHKRQRSDSKSDMESLK